ncbi:MAG: iron chelate uptake ABC transporter family permease subunit [Desulfobacterales bacterium]|nr:iron chelate uptake ABC transporter family permease subunit [Desulfobacterales bacterium]
MRWKATILLISAIALILVILTAISLGAYSIPLESVVQALLGKVGLATPVDGIHKTIIFEIRLPRILLAVAVGAALSTSGAVYQGIFRNPLVEPYILGVSSGAAFGAGLAVMFDFPLSVQALAFLFALVAVFLTYRIGRIRGRMPTVTIVLAGVIIGSLFSALFAIFQYIGSTEQLRRLVFWILGGLHRATLAEIRLIGPLVMIGVLLIWYHAWNLNVLTLGDDEARALGIPVERTRRLLIVIATGITALVVSISGIISWVGLMIPHAARLILGPDHRFVIPMSAILGAIFVIICDTLARTLSTGEIPIAIITSILGAPYLIYLLRTRLGQGMGG